MLNKTALNISGNIVYIYTNTNTRYILKNAYVHMYSYVCEMPKHLEVLKIALNFYLAIEKQGQFTIFL